MSAEHATTHDDDAQDAEIALPPVHHLTAAEARALFDENARHYLGISGEEFQRRWDAGEYRDNDERQDHASIWNVAILLPMVEK